ncbi:restriction endonuclease PLD domain-containing protein [Legionella pneumophila]|uniref:restriction endonuclease PLD domain-containing protein n=1 Tax=Legionella pneumophila TaxID=446 RepID=UPI001A20CC2B|nr:NgoFVII family restriction endonuclease [Legionella pneumophila]HAT2001471.1 NgoFVII family restriction endonuclease [Legionella pneumophila]HAU1811383.1 NgoFVII family restriction endonuclease [Legionella pneumophila]HAU2413765.1 NgoFVII family restriction endonuclease [Legionella pneumophila]HEB4962083.1 NgoFVII family restriction endonuclease [Legionella pneumophila]
MKLLMSNFPPLKMRNDKFNDQFHTLLLQSTAVNIATGYISEKAIDFIAESIYQNGGPFCNLVIGMHYFDKFTHAQYAAAIQMHQFLTSNHLGTVKLVTSFPFHGKLYSFKKDSTAFASIIGSSNLNNILLHNSIRQYETDILISEQVINEEINFFINELSTKSSLDLTEVEILEFKETNDLLTPLDCVVKLEDFQLAAFRESINKAIKFDIPLATYEIAPKSNINAHFGKGRKSKNGIVRARPWYEVELIVPRHIVDLPHYPKPLPNEKDRRFRVFTDDGYEFECIINGSGYKNFRTTKSSGGLTSLGKWLKGRLEKFGALKVGDPVTKEVLDRYGRNNFTLQATADPNLWFLDFSVNKL